MIQNLLISPKFLIVLNGGEVNEALHKVIPSW